MPLELTDPANVGGRIKWLRGKKNMTQTELAKSSGIGQSTLSDIEKMRSNAPNAANLLKIAAVLDANPSWIATGEGDPFKFDPPHEQGAQEIADIYSSLSPGKRAALLAAAKALKID